MFNKRGFTLVEILVVLGILAVILGLGLFMSFDSYRGYSQRSEESVVVSVLEKARGRAMANTDESPWGVCYAGGEYIVFAGSTCTPGAAGNDTVAANPGASIVGLSQAAPVVFTQLSGTTTPASVSVTQDGRTADVTINYEGTIVW